MHVMVIQTDLYKQSAPKKSLFNIFGITGKPGITKCRPRLCSYGIVIVTFSDAAADTVRRGSAHK
jgi:hypothetical protein